MRTNRPILVLSLVILAGCAGNRPPQFQVGDAAVRLTKAATATQAMILEANKAGALPNDATARAMAVFKQLAAHLERVAASLRVFEATDPTPEGVSDIERAIAEARAVMRALAAAIGETPVTSQVLQSLTLLDQLFTEIDRQLALWRAQS